MNEFKSEEKLNEDQYILEKRKYYMDLLQAKREIARNEVLTIVQWKGIRLLTKT